MEVDKKINAPLIFIHYGESFYLKYTLKLAKLFNPEKRVILIGDESNAHYTKFGLEHYLFDNYRDSSELEEFERVYQYLGGTAFVQKNYSDRWTKFNFRKWFVLYNFLIAHNLQKTWILDSDNLIISSLSTQEKKFIEYQNTEQCRGECMNGFINDINSLKGYILKINQLFHRPAYLEEQKKVFEQMPHYGFTMMRAYLAFKNEEAIRTIGLYEIIDGSYFDNALAHCDDMESYQEYLNQFKVKKVFVAQDGTMFNYHLPSQQMIKLNSINMSWLPEYLYKRIYKQALVQLKSPKNSLGYSRENLKILSIKPSLSYKIQKNKQRLMNKIKVILKTSY